MFSLIAFRNGQIAMGVRRINALAKKKKNYEKIYGDYMGTCLYFFFLFV